MGEKRNPHTVCLKTFKSQSLIAEKCIVAECFWDRFRGWIGRARVEPGEGLLFPRCNSVHMWFMRIPIDVVFLKREGGDRYTVTSTRSVRPWRPLPVWDRRATETLELPEGTIRRLAIATGETLCSTN